MARSSGAESAASCSGEKPAGGAWGASCGGEGTEAFCSGGDINVRGDDGYLGDDELSKKGIGRLNVLDLQIQIRRTPKPVVAMVAGWAIGGGHVLHVVCDLTIAAENAKFGQTGPMVGSFDVRKKHEKFGFFAANMMHKKH